MDISEGFWPITQKLSQIEPWYLFKSCSSWHDLSFEPKFIGVLQNYFFHIVSPICCRLGIFGVSSWGRGYPKVKIKITCGLSITWVNYSEIYSNLKSRKVLKWNTLHHSLLPSVHLCKNSLFLGLFDIQYHHKRLIMCLWDNIML